MWFDRLPSGELAHRAVVNVAGNAIVDKSDEFIKNDKSIDFYIFVSGASLKGSRDTLWDLALDTDDWTQERGSPRRYGAVSILSTPSWDGVDEFTKMTFFKKRHFRKFLFQPVDGTRRRLKSWPLLQGSSVSGPTVGSLALNLPPVKVENFSNFFKSLKIFISSTSPGDGSIK